ncbi:unnamed protein product, partial [Polarella glacialis]
CEHLYPLSCQQLLGVALICAPSCCYSSGGGPDFGRRAEWDLQSRCRSRRYSSSGGPDAEVGPEMDKVRTMTTKKSEDKEADDSAESGVRSETAWKRPSYGRIKTFDPFEGGGTASPEEEALLHSLLHSLEGGTASSAGQLPAASAAYWPDPVAYCQQQMGPPSPLQGPVMAAPATQMPELLMANMLACLSGSPPSWHRHEQSAAANPQDRPVLLGRTPLQIAPLAPLQPGALLSEVMPNGKERVRWSVDARKLESHDTKILSPEFSIELPGHGQQPFRLMVFATETTGRGGASFRKAGGRGRLALKCEASSLVGSNSACFRAFVGQRREPTQRPIWHNFSEHSCCNLQRGDQDWNFKAATDKDLNRFEVCLEVVEHAVAALP